MRRAGLALAIALVVGTTQSSCSLLAAGLYAHNSHGKECVETPAFAVIDIVGASLAGVLMVYTGTVDETPGWLAVPIVFGLSGIIGAASVYACTHPDVAPPPTIKPRGRFDEDAPPTPVGAQPDAGVDGGVADPPLDPEQRRCSIDQRFCPEGTSCVLTNGFDGFCRLARPH